MFYFMHVFFLSKFETLLYYLQSKKLTRKCRREFSPVLGALKLFGKILSRCSNPCMFSLEKNLRQYYFIFTPKNLLENAKVSLGVLSVFKLDLKSFFFQYLTQFIQNVILGHICFVLESMKVTFKYYPDSYVYSQLNDINR